MRTAKIVMIAMTTRPTQPEYAIEAQHAALEKEKKNIATNLKKMETDAREIDAYLRERRPLSSPGFLLRCK